MNFTGYKNFLFTHPRMATISPAEAEVLPSFTRHYVKDGIGVVPVKGFLSSDLVGWMGVTYSQIQSVLQKLEADPEVKGILLSVDSCGGDAAGCFELAEMIRKLSKPIETYVEAEASSAAYLVSSATNFITMHRSAFAGSIGAVVSAHKDPSIETKTITSNQSPFKSVDPWDEKGEARIKTHLSQIADLFIKDVATYRKTDPADVQSNYGQGDVLFSDQALRVNMVDSIGNFQTALTHLQNVIGGAGPDAGASAVPEGDTNTLSSNNNSNSNSKLKNRDKKIKRGITKMKRRIKTAFVLIDDSEVPEGATTVTEISIESLDENFPELMEEVKQAVRDEIAAGNEAVDDASEAADMADPEEAEAVAAARKGEITPEQLTSTLLKIKTAKLQDPELRIKTQAAKELQNRGLENPEVAASVGANGSDILDQKPTERNGRATASRINQLRNKKKEARK